jgi:hypothetical protein
MYKSRLFVYDAFEYPRQLAVLMKLYNLIYYSVLMKLYNMSNRKISCSTHASRNKKFYALADTS